MPQFSLCTCFEPIIWASNPRMHADTRTPRRPSPSMLGMLAVQTGGGDHTVDRAGPHDDEDIAGLAHFAQQCRRLVEVAAVVDGGGAALPGWSRGNSLHQIVAVKKSGVALARGLNLHHYRLVRLVIGGGERLQKAMQAGEERRLEDRDQPPTGEAFARRGHRQRHRVWMVGI